MSVWSLRDGSLVRTTRTYYTDCACSTYCHGKMQFLRVIVFLIIFLCAMFICESIYFLLILSLVQCIIFYLFFIYLFFSSLF